jgi:hypothetical protein
MVHKGCMRRCTLRWVAATAAWLLWHTAWAASFDVTPGQLRSVPPKFPLTVEVQLVHTGTTPTLYTVYATEAGEQIPIRVTRLRQFVMSRNGQSLRQSVQFLANHQRQRTVQVCAKAQEKGNPSSVVFCSAVVVK